MTFDQKASMFSVAFLLGSIFTWAVTMFAFGGYTITAQNHFAAGFDAGAQQQYVMLPPPVGYKGER